MYKKFVSGFIMIILLFQISACSGNSNESAGVQDMIKGNTLNTGGLNKVLPENCFMDSAILKDMDKYVTKYMSQITSIMVLRKGNIVFEKYYQGNEHSLREIRSVTKSLLSSLIGIAIKERFINSVDQKVIHFFPQYKNSIIDQQVNEITVKNLLTMTSGIPYSYSVEVYDQWRRGENLIRSAFVNKLVSEPGQVFNYNDPGVHILSGIISKSTNMRADLFAGNYLFGELGIEHYTWATDNQGNNIGCSELKLSTRDMAKFGQLYLNKGKWGEKQIIPQSWVEESTNKQNEGGAPSGENYGYLWWVTGIEGHSSFFAMGYGGQFIYVIPDMEIVTVITSTLEAHHEENRDIISKFIIPSVLD
jgi:CubicO group peptidase (beta-lactamase class C family)